MISKNYSFSFEEYESIDELSKEDAMLLRKAMDATENSYAPYSQFRVGAAAKLANGEYVTGSNQENASFPVGLCAERVLLSAVASLFPKTAIDTIAISYKADKAPSDHPIAPCGVCRQTLQEFEERTNHPVRLILGGMKGKIIIIPSASMLLTLAFDKEELG